MDNDRLSDNVDIRTCVHLPEIGRQLESAGALLVGGQIADVTKMKLAFSPFSVGYACGIPMPAGRRPVRRAAIAFLVDVHRVLACGRVVEFDDESDIVAVPGEHRLSGHAACVRLANHRGRLFSRFAKPRELVLSGDLCLPP